ncbi:hypothetical protein DICPUDRAFT_17925, partial [Dictyostelium purpureum]
DNHEISINKDGEITIELNKLNKRALEQDDDNTNNEDDRDNNEDDEPPKKVIKIGDICQVCNLEKSKYKCPGCSILFCSLICSNKHKIDNNCNGIRKDNHYIPLNKFKDSDIVNDFNFLEKINRVNENGKTILSNSFIKFKAKHLQEFAFKKDINLYIMPKEMSRHKENTTTFKKPKNIILWRVEWLFLDDDFKFIDNSIADSGIISNILYNHIDDPVNIYNLKYSLKKLNSNRDSNPNSNFIILMKRERDSKNQYYKFDLEKSLEENLKFKEVIEFPTLLIFNIDSDKLKTYNIIKEEELPEIENKQKEIIASNLNFRTKYDPNLTNTEDQTVKRNFNNNRSGFKKNKFRNQNNNNNN